MEAVESVWRFVVCGLRWAVGRISGGKSQWLVACVGRSEESAAGRVSGGKSQWWEESVVGGLRWAVGRISGLRWAVGRISGLRLAVGGRKSQESECRRP